MKQYKFAILITTFTLILIGLLLLSYQSPAQENDQTITQNQGYRSVQSMEKSVVMKEDTVQLDQAIKQQELTEDVMLDKLEAFINIFLQDIDLEYKVRGISTKAELIEQSTEIVSQEALQPYVDFYFEEVDNGLYVVPTELPPWFVPGNPYEMTQLDNGNVVIEQENEIELYGRYRVRIEFSAQENWRIVKIEHPPANGERLDLI
ncbi:hypothetical protein [Amphibacillus indicireducens]|uniref:DUF3993 domain-containing protein n=1 Tax=Amphibacillus indicireducens TaxID=1076330 RepID=A0ABP7VIS9_9BACI